MTGRGRAWARHLLAFGVTAACLVVFARQVDWPEVRTAISGFGWAYLVPGLLCLAAGYAMRILRWSLLLNAAGAAASPRDCAAPFLGSIALNNVLPLRMGDVIRALVFPVSMGVPRTVAMGSLLVERLIDMMSLVAAAAIGMLAVRAIEIPPDLVRLAIWIAGIGGLALIAGLLAAAPIARALETGARGRPGARALSAVGETLGALSDMLRPRRLLVVTVLSLLVWIGEAGLFYFLLLGLGIEAGPSVALLVMALTTLSTLVPSAPGYVGSFHVAAYAAVTLVGGAPAEAGSYAIIAHLALWLPTTLAGAAGLWARPDLFRTARERVAHDDAT